MIWMLLATDIAALVVMIILYVKVKRLNTEVDKVRYDLNQFRTRQTKIKTSRGSVPHVDSRVRVSARDSKDIPVTGRMSNTTKRMGIEVDRSNDDS